MLKFLGNLFCKIYNLLFSYLDSFSQKSNSYNFYNRGFKILRIKKEVGFKKKNKEIKINRYLNKIIIDEDKIYKIIDNIFIENDFKKKISKLTGFNFSIDYFVAYKTKSISKKHVKKGWYANHWHKDKPFSKYFIKLIIPMENINNQMGGIELLSSKNSKKELSKNIRNDYKMITSKNEILIFSPNLCYHKAGNPISGKERNQIMLQLNPSKKWRYNKELYSLQKKKEPKFPYFSYFLHNKKNF
mgnify:CR=1 FL=1